MSTLSADNLLEVVHAVEAYDRGTTNKSPLLDAIAHSRHAPFYSHFDDATMICLGDENNERLAKRFAAWAAQRGDKVLFAEDILWGRTLNMVNQLSGRYGLALSIGRRRVHTEYLFRLFGTDVQTRPLNDFSWIDRLGKGITGTSIAILDNNMLTKDALTRIAARIRNHSPSRLDFVRPADSYIDVLSDMPPGIDDILFPGRFDYIQFPDAVKRLSDYLDSIFPASEAEAGIQYILDSHIEQLPNRHSIEEWHISNMCRILRKTQPLVDAYMSERPSYISENTWYCLYFNNFHLLMPGDLNRTQLVEFLDDLPLRNHPDKNVGHLWQDMDSLIKRFGLMDQVLYLKSQMEIRKKNKQSDSDLRRRLLELTFPVYIGLRAFGYTPTELKA